MTTKEQVFFKQSTSKNKIHFISLGCSRNLVDSEVMLGILLKAGYEATEVLPEADYLVLNTCAFLKAARNESIDYLQHIIDTKKKDAKIILTGCMVSKHKEELSPWLPHIHYLLGSGDVEHILSAIESKESGEKRSAKSYLEMGDIPRKLSTPKHYAYLKIAEGCCKRCSFCIIPTIKGKLRSKPVDQVVKEFRLLLNLGVKEIILIAQDLGDYGRDFSSDRKSYLSYLLQTLLKEPGDYWIRMLYLYPDEVDDSIIDLMEKDHRLLPYVDIPIQHINNRILKNMRRTTSKEQILDLLTKLRTRISHIYIRSSFIVGFPGETDEEFQELVDFIKSSWIDHVGIFPYSQEEGSPAADMPDQIPQNIKLKRLKTLSQVQKKNVIKHNKQLIGKVIEAVIDGYHPDSKLLFTARFYGQAPEVDPCIIVNEAKMISNFGERCLIEITDIAGYDLVGRIIKKCPETNFPGQ
ncbi:Ribosomal protein S12 methylthiotransferase RimO [Chlamydia avium]|nr:30S ribosomal protein S12 methylthiotransferase RimO [Chlamydia avium]EPP36411.1 ribosomal protein S12 methylthiotransferase RimO [Chlamydia psittaci 10_743_SC13]EPP38413.1 ribosomal protein S12 methylthiotransferase RimO [Chlamydia avium]VVT42807.1 Ribosomal protein S12 methylthiotransferase RimO [Chlamydia avium]